MRIRVSQPRCGAEYDSIVLDVYADSNICCSARMVGLRSNAVHMTAEQANGWMQSALVSKRLTQRSGSIRR